MATNQNFTELDFDQIKEGFREFLESQSQFSDYNFEGSNLSILLDILAYNQQYQAFYNNMTFAESFLRSAVLRKNVVNGAKNIGFTPRSARSASATVQLDLTPVAGHTDSIIIPIRTKFSGTNNDGDSFTFQTDQEIVVPNNGGVYSTTATIFEGKFFTFRKTISSGDNGVTIPNQGVDTNRLRVFVKQSSASASRVEYAINTDYPALDGTSKAYFLEEVDGELFRVYFGDGIIGAALTAGNVVEIEYYLSSGLPANQISNFAIDDTITFTDFVQVTTTSPSSGGRPIQSIEEIRLIAPLFYQAQNRAVTAADYQAIILQNFSNVDDAVAWGGEENVPPNYGEVFISLKPLANQSFSETEKEDIINFLKENYTVVSVEPRIEDEVKIQAIVSSEVFYDSAINNPGAVQVHSDVVNAVKTYNTVNLDKFGKDLRYSRLVRDIDDSNDVIINSNTEVQMYFQIGDKTDILANNFSFYNQVDPGSIRSQVFTYDIYPLAILRDDGTGNILVYEINAGVETPISPNIVAGSINYVTGDITFDFAEFDQGLVTLSTNYRLTGTPTDFDISVEKNRYINIKDIDIVITVTDVQTDISYSGA